jgi:hypothetical protein
MVLIYVFPEMKLHASVISKTEVYCSVCLSIFHINIL